MKFGLEDSFSDVVRRLQEAAATAFRPPPIRLNLEIPPIRLDLEKALEPLNEFSRRFARATASVASELPKRGWYLSGAESVRLVEDVSRCVEERDLAKVDEILLKHATGFRLDNERFLEWLKQHGVPHHCIERIRLVLAHRESGSHEVATIVGVAVIDELSRHLYDGRELTTKRNKQPRPQIACRTPTSKRELTRFSLLFVEDFGSLQKNIDPKRLADENYFNRHAILHGRMRRRYGPKDSSKVFMLLMFLVFGLDESEVPSDRQ